MSSEEADKEIEPEPIPSFPYWRVIGHAATKGFQVSSMVNLALVSPGIYYYYANKIPRSFKLSSSKSFFSISRMSGTFGAVLGASLGAGMAWNILRQEPWEAVEDRAYRLHENMGQRRIDLYTAVACASVFALSVAWRKSAFQIVGNAILAAPLGISAHALHLAVERKK